MWGFSWFVYFNALRTSHFADHPQENLSIFCQSLQSSHVVTFHFPVHFIDLKNGN